MKTKVALVLLAVVIAVSAGAALTGAAPTSAHKDACPRWKDWKGGEFSDLKSAHDAWKQAKRECKAEPAPTPSPKPHKPRPTPTATLAAIATPTLVPTAQPTPTPAPTPVPQDQADVWIVSVGVSGPASAAAGVQFHVFVIADVQNSGPAASVLADTTFTASAPGDCVLAPSAPVVVEDSSLAMGTGVAISRVWAVTCTAAGAHTIGIGAAIAIDASQAMTDPDPSNNSGTGSVAVMVQ